MSSQKMFYPDNPNRLQRMGTNSNEMGDKATKVKSALPWDHYKEYCYMTGENPLFIYLYVYLETGLSRSTS